MEGSFFEPTTKEEHGDIGTLYFASVFTKFRGQLIGEDLTARSPEELDQAADSLLGISFQEDQINHKCSTAGGLSGGTSGSTPNGPESHPALPQRVRVSSGVAQGLLIKKVPPEYPAIARQTRIQGTVILQAEIDQNGEIEDLTLVSGHPMLAPAAMAAVKQWKYKPYRLKGEPVNVETQITVNFALSPR